MYVVAIITAPAAAPFFCGLIVRSSWRNLFWVLLGLGGLQLVLFFFFVPETQWVEGEAPAAESDKDIEHREVAAAEGRVGAAFYPWQRPGEFLRICLGPMAMVSRPLRLSALLALLAPLG
jgi:MFS family permease